MSKKVSFVEAVSLGFRNYAKFRGTASRSEFWYWTLFTVLLSLVITTIETAIWPPAQPTGDLLEDLANTPQQPISLIVSIAIFLPNLAVTARRFRDAGFSAKWLLLSLVPILYSFFAIGGTWVIIGSALTPELTPAELIPIVFLVVPLFALIAVIAIIFLIFTLRPTRSFYDGNKYAEPQPLGPGDEIGTTA